MISIFGDWLCVQTNACTLSEDKHRRK